MKLLIGGDLFVGDRIEARWSGSAPNPLDELTNIVTDHDLLVVNLEGPLTRSSAAIAKTGPAMRMEPRVAGWLRQSGIGMCTLANNHIFDYGPRGLEETNLELDAQGIGHVGAGKNLEAAERPFIVEKDGLAVAILNFAENEWSTTHGAQPGACPVDPVRNYQAIRQAQSKADHVVLIVHGGHEHYELPSPRMQKLYRFYAEVGADLVINHHQHCLSGWEMHGATPIYYGLGNFLFDHDRFRDTDWNKGLLVSLEFDGDMLKGVERIHFNQCNEEPLVQLCSEAESQQRECYLESLNLILADEAQLDACFERHIENKANQYQSYIEPFSSRILHALIKRGMLPSLLSGKKRRLLHNLIRSESHREILERILEKR